MVKARKPLAQAIAVACLMMCVAAATWAAAPKEEQKMRSTQELIRQFAEFRLDFARQPGYTAMSETDEERKAVMEALREDRSADFLSLSERWLEKYPVDAPIHWVRAAKMEESGDAIGAIYHRMMFFGLLMSIIASGDGRTEASAYTVISVAEEYALLNYLGARLKSQHLRGHCDVMEVELDGETDTMYFDVSIALGALNRELGGGTKKQ